METAHNYRRVSLFSYTGVPLVNLLYIAITWLKFQKIPKWFRNATAWSRTPKMILIKHGCHMPPYQAKISYIPIVKFCVTLVSVQLEFSNSRHNDHQNTSYTTIPMMINNLELLFPEIVG